MLVQRIGAQFHSQGAEGSEGSEGSSGARSQVRSCEIDDGPAEPAAVFPLLNAELPTPDANRPPLRGGGRGAGKGTAGRCP